MCRPEALASANEANTGWILSRCSLPVNGIMNFSSDLLAFQGAIMSADNKYSFSRITSRGGNEEKIKSIAKSLCKFFEDKKFNSANMSEKRDSEMRKFCFYLILNVEFTALKEIAEYPNVGHLIWSAPAINKCMLSDLVFMLNMETYTGEIITYSNPLLSIELLKVLVNGVRYLSAQSSINKLHELALATYRCIHRLSLFSYDKPLISSILSDLYNCFLRSITHFVSPPNNGKLEELSLEERYVHLGQALRSLFDVTLKCLKELESTLLFSPDGFEIYLDTVDTKVVKNKDTLNNVDENIDAGVLEFLQKCNIALLDKCVELVMKVSLDVYCCWSEHEVDDKTLQRTVGELAYQLHNKLDQTTDISHHTLLKMLPPICCKPLDVFDIIGEADNDTIIANASSDIEEREHWLNAIIDKSNLFENKGLLSCLLSNLIELKPEACEKLFKRTIVYLKENKYENEHAKKLAANCFVSVNPEKKCDLIIDVFPNRVLHTSMETTDFNSKMNEIFNKFISTADCSLYEVFDVFLQNPYAVYEKMLSVGVENTKQANLMLEMCVMLSPFSEYYCEGEKEPALVKAINKLCSETLDTEIQQNSFVRLLSGINGEITVVHNHLLLVIIMPLIRKCVLSKNLERLRLMLRLLGNAYEVRELMRWCAPLLVTLARVLEVVRWNLANYSAHAPAALQEAAHLVNNLFDTYSSQIPDKDANWLKANLRTLNPLNGYYFKEVWHAPGENFVEVITSTSKIEIDDYPPILAKILSSCTLKEWVLVWDSLVPATDRKTALELMQQSLALMGLAESQHRTKNSYLCIHYCYRNFTSIIKERYLSDPSNEADVDYVLNVFVELANSTREEDIEDIGGILLPLLSSLKGRASNIKAPAEITNRLKHGKFAKLVGEALATTAL